MMLEAVSFSKSHQSRSDIHMGMYQHLYRYMIFGWRLKIFIYQLFWGFTIGFTMAFHLPIVDQSPLIHGGRPSCHWGGLLHPLVQRLAQQHAGGELRHLAVLVSEVGGNAVNPNKKNSCKSIFTSVFCGCICWFMVYGKQFLMALWMFMHVYGKHMCWNLVHLTHCTGFLWSKSLKILRSTWSGRFFIVIIRSISINCI